MPRDPFPLGIQTTYIVRWDSNRELWTVFKEGARRSLRTFDTKAPAVTFARKTARENAPSKLQILNKRAGIAETATYD